jgi:succinate dehydrogenase/fumarate reductase cytochrome b subunit
MFIWLFHRISGLVLILLFGLKLVTGLFMYTKGQKPELALLLHTQKVVDVMIIILFIFHSLYGLRTVLMDLGIRREKMMFWASTLVASSLSIIVLIAYFIRITSE